MGEKSRELLPEVVYWKSNHLEGRGIEGWSERITLLCVTFSEKSVQLTPPVLIRIIRVGGAVSLGIERSEGLSSFEG